MKFDITKKIPLEYDGWENCYLEFSLPSFGDLKDFVKEGKTDAESAEKGLEVIKKIFKSGFAMSKGKRVEVQKDDLDNMPIEVLIKCFKEISGELPPNK